MGFEVHVVAQLSTSPNAHVLEELGHHFGEVSHEHGSKSVRLTEHVSMPSEIDAIEFVRGLAIEALPEGAKIVEITATAG